VLIREEKPEDIAGIRGVISAAFGRPAEADIVDALRQRAQPFVSLVAEHEGEVVGHILFTPVTLAGGGDLKMAALAPMAVAPKYQVRGVGAALVLTGFEHLRLLGMSAVVVIGHPSYYPRFGFSQADAFGLKSEYNVPDDVFMACELDPGALAGVIGTVSYHPVFRETQQH
jgi:putative acetyltransferase